MKQEHPFHPTRSAQDRCHFRLPGIHASKRSIRPGRMIAFALLALASLSSTLPASYPLREYNWSNPEFRNRFIGTYGINPAIEPRIDRIDSQFLREQLLPLLETDPPAAIPAVEAWLETRDAPALFIILGNLYLEKGLLVDAASAFQTAIARFPDFRRAHRGLAITRFRQEDYPAANASWIKVISLGGGDDQSYGLLGYGYLVTGEPYAALQGFQNARLFAPSAVDLLRGEVESLRQLERPREALEVLDRLLAEEPEDASLWKVRSNLLVATGNFSAGAAALEVAHQLQTPDRISLLRLGDLYLELDLPIPALENYRRALAAGGKPALPDALRSLRLLHDRGYLEEARELLVKAPPPASPDPADPRLAAEWYRIQASLTLDLDNDPAAAAEAAREAVRLDPLNQRALLLAGAIEERLGNPSAATILLERATRTGNDPSTAWLSLARLQLSNQQWAEARESLREAESLRPTPQIRRTLDRLEEILQDK